MTPPGLEPPPAQEEEQERPVKLLGHVTNGRLVAAGLYQPGYMLRGRLGGLAWVWTRIELIYEIERKTLVSLDVEDYHERLVELDRRERGPGRH